MHENSLRVIHQWVATPIVMTSGGLTSPTAKVVQDGYYQNDQGAWGYNVTVWNAGHYHMISVSHTDRPPSIREIAEALVAPNARIESDGR
jgi:hypothetical protein